MSESKSAHEEEGGFFPSESQPAEQTVRVEPRDRPSDRDNACRVVLEEPRKLDPASQRIAQLLEKHLDSLFDLSDCQLDSRHQRDFVTNTAVLGAGDNAVSRSESVTLSTDPVSKVAPGNQTNSDAGVDVAQNPAHSFRLFDDSPSGHIGESRSQPVGKLSTVSIRKGLGKRKYSLDASRESGANGATKSSKAVRSKMHPSGSVDNIEVATNGAVSRADESTGHVSDDSSDSSSSCNEREKLASVVVSFPLE